MGGCDEGEGEETAFPEEDGASREAAARPSTREDSMDCMTSSCDWVLDSLALSRLSKASSLASRDLVEDLDGGFSMVFLDTLCSDASDLSRLVDEPDEVAGGTLSEKLKIPEAALVALSIMVKFNV